jgi:hypothetical protein
LTNPLPRRLSKPGPLLEYLRFLHEQEALHPQLKGRFNETVQAIKTVASTKEGAILLDLLDKSTVDFRMSPDTDPRALDALNAQSFIALDLRRIVSNEIEQLLDRKKNLGTR